MRKFERSTRNGYLAVSKVLAAFATSRIHRAIQTSSFPRCGPRSADKGNAEVTHVQFLVKLFFFKHLSVPLTTKKNLAPRKCQRRKRSRRAFQRISWAPAPGAQRCSKMWITFILRPHADCYSSNGGHQSPSRVDKLFSLVTVLASLVSL